MTGDSVRRIGSWVILASVLVFVAIAAFQRFGSSGIHTVAVTSAPAISGTHSFMSELKAWLGSPISNLNIGELILIIFIVSSLTKK